LVGGRNPINAVLTSKAKPPPRGTWGGGHWQHPNPAWGIGGRGLVCTFNGDEGRAFRIP